MVGAGGAAAGAVEALTRAGARVLVVARRPAGRARSASRLARRSQRGCIDVAAWTADALAARARRRRRAGLRRARRRLGRPRRRAARASTRSTPRPPCWRWPTAPATPLAARCAAARARYADGLGMLVHQAPHAIKLALGKTPPLPPLFEPRAASCNGFAALVAAELCAAELVAADRSR